MRLWTNDFNGRLFLKKQFLQVRRDPFRSSDDVEGLYVFRIEVYPETEEEMYFALKLKKNDQIIKI